MTDFDKEYNRFWQGVKLLAAFLLGLGIGGAIVSIRYDVDIRTDQVELIEKVDGIIDDKTIMESVIKTFLFETEQLRLERQDLKELQIRLSEGEKKKEGK